MSEKVTEIVTFPFRLWIWSKKKVIGKSTKKIKNWILKFILVWLLIWKIKEAQEKTPKRIAAREDFDELIQKIQKLAKV